MNLRPFIYLSLIVLLLGYRSVYGQTQQSHKVVQPDSTRLMAQFLAGLATDSNEQIARHMPNPDLRNYFLQIKYPLDRRSRILLTTQQAYKLLVFGKNEEAANLFLSARTSAARTGLLDHHFVRAVSECLAIAYLRLAENDNTTEHDKDACVLLLSDFASSYKNLRWSRAAIREYEELLADKPDDLSARWFLNLAYMTTGEYPAKVPQQWLIPPERFKSDYTIKQFSDVAPRVGLDYVGRGGGVITEDFDRDGYIDIIVSSAGLGTEHDQLRYFHNDANGSFSDRTAEAGLKGITGGLSISSADYNNDGYVDVFIPRGAWLGQDGAHPPSLLKNNGNGTFSDVTAQAGLFTLYPSNTSVWADFDNDGWLDLFVGNETTPQDKDTNPCQLFHNNGDGTFSDVAADVGLDVTGWVKGAAWGDFDNDGRPDLYVSRLFETNLLFHNESKAGKGWKFKDVTDTAGVAAPLDSFSCWFWDYDNDGWQDLFVASASADDFTHVVGQVAADYLGLPFTAETPRLYRNNHDGRFVDVTNSSGLHHALYTMGGNFGDIDNDGWLDIYLGTGNPMFQGLMPNRMLRSAEGRYFQDVTTSGGFGHLQKGHGIAFADLDNDGDQDVFAVLGGVYPGDTHPRVLYENPGFGNHWITLRLEGTKSNRSAIGARIKVQVSDQTGSRNIYASVSTGGSMGASALQRLIGLGQATSIDSIEVTWPTTGEIQNFRNVQLDQILKIREGDPTPQLVSVSRLNFNERTSRVNSSILKGTER
ncbi:MAG TPA: CRTAC1 family protein [Pyrinomonadaceae bacterium]